MKINFKLLKVLVCLLAGVMLFSCKQNHFLYNLKLTTEQYDQLKKYNGDQLTLQFFYPENKKASPPSLYAYAMKAIDTPTGKPPQIMTFGAVSTEPFTGRAQVLSDQHILNADMNDLLTEVEGGYAGKKLYFLFTPKFDSSNPHIYFEVKLEGSKEQKFTTIKKTNPCPPGCLEVSRP